MGLFKKKTCLRFPYDWRLGVSQNVDNLKNKINQIVAQTGSEKVDVVAHSTGGLIVKKYVIDNNDHKIGKAVFLGVPNLGAPQGSKSLIGRG